MIKAKAAESILIGIIFGKPKSVKGIALTRHNI